jgi:phytoene dehydrogenase-like protein
MRSGQSNMSRRVFLRGLYRSAVIGGGTLLTGCPPRPNTVHVIGSGITGLCAGALLARKGLEVCVLESHPELTGGHTAGFQRNGFQFCVGPQYVWNFRDGGIGARVLRDLGLDEQVPFDAMAQDGFDVYRIDDTYDIPVPMGLDRFRDTAMDTFPGDFAGLDLFFSYLGDLHEGAAVIDRLGLYTLGENAMALGILLDSSMPPRAKTRFHQCRRWTLAQLFDYCGLSQPARRFLYGNSGIFAENESAVSCIAYAAATGYFHAGADFPRFGFQSLVQGLSDCITNSGGSVRTNKRVIALRRSPLGIARLQCQDGESFETGCVISTLSPRLTCAMLDPPAACQASYAPSNSAVSAFVGVRDYPGLPAQLERRVRWWQDGQGEVEFEAPDLVRAPRMLALASPTSNSIHAANPYPGDHSLIVFAPGNFVQAAAEFARSPEAHDGLRAQIADLLLDRIESDLLPGLRPHIRFLEVHTSYDLYERTLGESGNIYGRRLTPGSLLTRPFALNGVPNLHIACATTGMPGIATAFQAAARLVESI